MRRRRGTGRRTTASAAAEWRCVSWDPVPHSRYGFYHLWLAQLSAQLHERHPYDVREWIDVLVPRPLQQLLGRDDRPAGLQQLSEKGELLARQGNVATVAEGLVPGRVER